ncbi:MAG: hypothetical protein AABY22_13920 [Nanoarchaeota archaeon]
MEKLYAGFLYFIEYIIILPFLVFFWFFFFVIFLVLLSSNIKIESLLFVSAALIAVVRIAAYSNYGKEFAENLSGLLPFTFLAVSLFDPQILSIQRVVDNFFQIFGFLDKIILYLIFIIGIEIILRGFDFIFSLFSEEDYDE